MRWPLPLRTRADYRANAKGVAKDIVDAEAKIACPDLPHEKQPEGVTRLLVDFLENWKG